MTLLNTADTVAVWFQDGRPERLVWQGRRYRVSDTPTPIRGDELVHEAITHPIAPAIGWRFQGTNDTAPADVRVFDIIRRGVDSWCLQAIYV